MSNGAATKLGLGSNVVQLLIPQRWPLALVDRIERITEGDAPVLEAARFVSANDVMFQGHFPDLHLWPGVLTIEGLGQTCALLSALLAIREQMRAVTGDGAAAWAALRNLERGFRLHPGHDAAAAEVFRAQMASLKPQLSVGAAVDIRFRNPVFAGQQLHYRARLSHVMGDMMRFEVEATVDGAVAAEGTMTGARVPRPRPAGG